MADSTQSLLMGVALATLGFFFKEATTTRVKAFRLRKVLIADINGTLPALERHKPRLSDMKTNLNNDLASYIWDSSSHANSPAYLAEVPVYLSTAESTLALEYYDCLSRLDAIRVEFNSSVRSIITVEQTREEFKLIAMACLGDLERNYEDAIRLGHTCMKELQDKLWFDDGSE